MTCSEPHLSNTAIPYNTCDTSTGLATSHVCVPAGVAAHHPHTAPCHEATRCCNTRACGDVTSCRTNGERQTGRKVRSRKTRPPIHQHLPLLSLSLSLKRCVGRVPVVKTLPCTTTGSFSTRALAQSRLAAVEGNACTNKRPGACGMHRSLPPSLSQWSVKYTTGQSAATSHSVSSASSVSPQAPHRVVCSVCARPLRTVQMGSVALRQTVVLSAAGLTLPPDQCAEGAH